ncbi:PREDICTED: small ribosomal subunit protein S13, mitochondrial [Tarenaya hassleriana]|uniref:small ribosomal subunit protein S13, mitochondrial n=1 Tax=Tarenaya hassleriana TaxID=28532 RepID=UPI00053C1239|nr:PREDICTED: small ribosomal subunit protein S13, mitochondrial [Tarenaya hassleriana]
MLGLRKSSGTLFDIGQSLLRNLSFHGLRVQGIRVGNAEVPNHKPLGIGLQEVYGIGRRKSHQILCELGISNKLARDLTGKEVMDLREEVSRHQHGDELKRRVNAEIQRLIDVDCYRGSRHRLGLPCRGQRTKTNARTLKGRSVAIAGKKKAPRK